MDWLMMATVVTGIGTAIYLVRLFGRYFGGSSAVAVYFSPKGGCTDAIVAELQRARRSIQVLAYTFASRPIAQALVDAKLRGVDVDLVLDPAAEDDPHSDLAFFVEQGLTPLIDENHTLAHNKVIVVDGVCVVTGSFNFTQQAESENAENVLIIRGHRGLAAAYGQNFVEHKAHARAAQVLSTKAMLRKAA
jgi:phosphatidylserine/phosphatidylglycerophosphate/cardiolipin synthase-like enzyme